MTATDRPTDSQLGQNESSTTAEEGLVMSFRMTLTLLHIDNNGEVKWEHIY